MRKTLSFLTLLVFMIASVPVFAQTDTAEVDKFVFAGIPYSFEYPAHWATDEYFGISLVAEDATALTQASLQPSTDKVSLWVAPVEFLYFIWEMHDTPDNVIDMGKLVSRYAGDPRSINWKFDNPTTVNLTNHRQAAIVTGYDAAKKSAATFIVAEYDKRFIVLFASGPDGSQARLKTLVTDAANSLKIGNEVALEHVTVKNSHKLNLKFVSNITTDGDSVYASVYGCDTCENDLVKISMQAAVLETKKNFGPARLVVNKDGTFWAIIPGADLLTFRVSLVSNDGKELKSLDLKESYPPLMGIGPDGNVYMDFPRKIKPFLTPAPVQVQNHPSEDWVQVRDKSGTLLREFMVNSEDETLAFGSDGLSFDPQGNIYLIFARTNKGIVIYQPDGQLVKKGFARGKVMYQYITGFDIVKDGTIFLGVDTGDRMKPVSEVLHLDKDGKLLGVFPVETLGIDNTFRAVHFLEMSNGQISIVAVNSQEGIQISTIEIASSPS